MDREGYQSEVRRLFWVELKSNQEAVLHYTLGPPRSVWDSEGNVRVLLIFLMSPIRDSNAASLLDLSERFGRSVDDTVPCIAA